MPPSSRYAAPAADRVGLREAAHPIMERPATHTGETVNLGVLDGTRVLNLHKVESRHLLRMHLTVGSGVPTHATALGKVLLAALESDELARRLRGRRLECLTRRTIGDRTALRSALARVREQGFAVDDEECSLGLRCVAAPILDRRGSVVAALSISGPTQRFPHTTLSGLTEVVRAAARELPRCLGYSGDSSQRGGET